MDPDSEAPTSIRSSIDYTAYRYTTATAQAGPTQAQAPTLDLTSGLSSETKPLVVRAIASLELKLSTPEPKSESVPPNNNNRSRQTPSPTSTLSPTIQTKIKTTAFRPRLGRRRCRSLPNPAHGSPSHCEPRASEEGDEQGGVADFEGVERDGKVWGMDVEAYRALSAKERKRVRNRICAKMFRAKHKGERAREDPASPPITIPPV
jgi:hypothetical protein